MSNTQSDSQCWDGSICPLQTLLCSSLPFTNSPLSRRYSKGYSRGGVGLVRDLTSEQRKAISPLLCLKKTYKQPLKTQVRKTQKLDVTYCNSNPE